MIKRQLNPLRIGKGLLCLLALFVMLLAPQVARAEDSSTTYTFTGMTGSSVSGYTYDVPSTAGGESKIWRVKNFSATDESHGNRTTSAYVLSESSLGISNIFATSSSATIIDFELESDFTLSGSFVSAEITYSTSSMSQCKAVVYKLDNYLNTLTNPNATLGTSPVTLSLKSDFEDQKNFDENKIALGFTFTTNRYDGYSGEFSIQSITINTTPLTYYNLWVGGRQVNTGNARNVMGDGGTPTVVFDESTSTLTLTNATINGNIESSLADDLTVHLVGANVIHNDEHAFLMSGNGGLKFTAASGAKLLTDATTDAMFAYSTSGSSAISLGINDLPNGYKLSYDAKLKRCIGESYDILIYAFTNGSSNLGPQCVTSANCDRLAGAYDETTSTWDNETITLSYNYSTTTLTLNNMNLETASPNGTVYFINCDGTKAKNITINLLGENKLRQFNGEEGARFIYNGHEDGQITITTDPQNPGSLTMPDMSATLEETDVLEMYYTNHVNYKNGLGYSKDENNVRYIQTLPSIGLTVAGVPVNASNASNVLDEVDEETELPTVSFDAEHNILTLNGANIYVENEDAIVSGLENLTVFLVGENYITSYGNSSFAFNKSSAVDEATITFTTNAESNGSLTITKDESFLSGEGVTLAYTNVLKSLDGWTHTITSSLGLSVGGVPVTLFNSTDVFGDNKVSYNSTTHTLKLDNATIESAEENPGIVYENEDDLTIALIGNNSIQGAAGCTAIEKRNGVETPKLYFAKGDATQNFSLTLIADSEDDFIDGFDTTYGSFFVFNDEDDGIYTKTICSSILGGTGSTDEPFLIKTAQDLKNFASYLNESVIANTSYVKLSDDIGDNGLDCTSLAFEPIGYDNTHFLGTFDGNNKTIKNLTVNDNAGDCAGFIRILGEGGILKDLTIDNLTLSGGNSSSNNIGGLVAYLNGGTISNCTVKNSSISCRKDSENTSNNTQNPTVGGIAGQSSGTITNCTLLNSSVKAETCDTWSSGARAIAGGIVGQVIGGSISGCQVKGTTTILADYGEYMGTIAAGALFGNYSDGQLSENTYEYTVTTTEKVYVNDPELQIQELQTTDKSGYTQRAVGGKTWNEQTEIYETVPDVMDNNGAVMYTQTVTLPEEISQASVFGEENTYYSTAMISDALAYLVAPGQTVTLNATPVEGYVITALTATNTTTEATISTSSENLGDYITQYTFIMPDAPVTVTLTAAQTMGIRVAGVEVTELNADDVLGDGKVSFTPAGDGPATLTLNNATINGRIFSSLQGGLTVYLLGSNIIDGGYVENNTNQPGEIAFVTEGENMPLTFTTNKTTPGLLLMKNTARYEGNAKYYQGFTESLESGLVSTSNDNKCLIAKAPVVEPGEGIHWTDQTYTISGLEGATIKYKDYLGKISETTYNEPFGIQNTGKYYLGIWQTLTVAETEFDLYSNNVNYIVHNKPTFSLSTENVYESPAELKLENLPTDLATTIDTYPQVWYYFGENVEDSVQYTSAEQTIAVSESTKVCVYILDEDSDKIYKSKTVEAEYDVRASAGLSYIDTQTAKPVELVQYTIGGEDNPTLPMLTNESELPVSFSSSETDVATIDEEGNVTIVGVGLTRITATTEMTEVYAPGEVSYNLIVYKDLSHESIQITVENAVFDGEAKTPAEFITLIDGDYELTFNEDYRISSPEGSVTNVGSYTVTIEGDLDESYYVGSKQVTFNIVNRTLAAEDVEFYNHWTTYYFTSQINENLDLPENIGAYIVLESGIGEKTVTVTQIKSIPRGEVVLLNNETTTTTENTSVEGNLLRHADNDIDADAFEGLIYGLHNGKLMRVSGTIPADRNYLVAWEAQAPQLTIVFEGETTGVNDVRSKTAETGADFYDLTGRKVQKPSKKGLYISNGRKVVVK